MNQKFLCDFYRMTGKKFKRNIKSYLNIMFQHNVRYMYWWRKRNKKFIGKIARVFLFKYSKKYGLEIGNAKIEEGFYLGTIPTQSATLTALPVSQGIMKRCGY